MLCCKHVIIYKIHLVICYYIKFHVVIYGIHAVIKICMYVRVAHAIVPCINDGSIL